MSRRTPRPTATAPIAPSAQGVGDLLCVKQKQVIRPYIPVVDITTARYNAAAHAVGDVLAFDADNLFPERVRGLTYTPFQQPIVEQKTRLTVGDGLYFDADNEELAEFVANENGAGDMTLDDVVENCARDLITYGGYYIRVRLSEGPNPVIAALDYVPFAQIRAAYPQPGCEVEEFIYAVDWRNPSLLRKEVGWTYRIPRFRANKAKKQAIRDNQREFLLFRYRATDILQFYPLPDWWSVQIYLQSTLEMAQFISSTITNAFLPSAVIAYPSMPDGEQKEAIAKQVEDFMTGANNAAKVLLMFGHPNAEGASQMPTVTAFQGSANADVYNEVHQIALEVICTAHRMPPTLLGINKGSLSIAGSSEEIANFYELAIANVIRPYQNTILRDLRTLAEFNGIDASSLDLITPVPPTFRVSQSALAAVGAGVMTVDEAREMFGYAPLGDVTAEELPIEEQERRVHANARV